MLKCGAIVTIINKYLATADGKLMCSESEDRNS